MTLVGFREHKLLSLEQLLDYLGGSSRVPTKPTAKACHVIFEVGDSTQTNVGVPANLHPEGWNTGCNSGAATPEPTPQAP